MFLPGTIVEMPSDYNSRTVLSSLFLAGGLVLSQIAGMTGLQPHVLQNWIGRGFVSPPVKKKYSKDQFCRFAIINFLKDNLQLDMIVKLISHVNGKLETESDDLIKDSELYCCFVETAILSGFDTENVDKAVEKSLAEYDEPFPGARAKIASVLKIMTILYISSQIKNSAEILLRSLDL